MNLCLFCTGAMIATALCACGVPNFQGLEQTPLLSDPAKDTQGNVILTKAHMGPAVDDIIYNIQCEILKTIGKNPLSFQTLTTDQYIGAATLTVEISNAENFDPSISFIDPYRATATGLSLAIGAQLEGVQHKSHTITFPIRLTPPTSTDEISKRYQTCATASSNGEEKKHDGIRGELGLDLTLQMGMKSYQYLIGSKQNVAFGSTIDFTIVEGINGGPAQTTTHFKGPNPATGPSVLAAKKTIKNTLIISFAPPKPAAPAYNVRSIPPPIISPTSRLSQKEFDLSIPAQIARAELQMYADAINKSLEAAKPDQESSAFEAARQNNTQMILQAIQPLIGGSR